MRVILLATFVIVQSAPAMAHETAEIVVSPSSWDLATLAGLVVAGCLYAVGMRRLSARGVRVRRIERIAFWAGWTALLAAVAPPLDAAAATMFSAHMAQHELLMLVGAPLIIVGRPIVAWLWALPDALRPSAGAALAGGAVATMWRWLTTPFIAWGLHGLAIWVWHLPLLYEAALRHESVHALQHATFVGTAVFFWWGLVYGRYGRAAYGASGLYVFVTSVHTGVLGAMFTLSNAPYYALYAARAPEAGIDALTDQQLAGLYMWIPAGMVLTLFGLSLVVAWVAESDRRTSIRNST
jgi:putative membrane protein